MSPIGKDAAHRSTSGPVSVALPADLKRRIALEAKRRELKLSTAMRVLVSERIKELEDAEDLSRAEQFQRAEAWATWDKLKAGPHGEVSRAALDEEFVAARRRASRSKRP